MMQAGHQIQSCMEAWLNCENLLINLAKQKKVLSEENRQVVDECAYICLGTLHALKSKMKNVHELALLCIGICEECAEICDRYDDVLFKNCAASCRQCSSAITDLAAAAV